MPDWDPCPDTQYHKGVEITGNSHCPNPHHKLTCYAAENTKPHHAWKRSYVSEFTMGHPIRMGELLGTSEGVGLGTTQSPLESHCPATSWTCWNTLCPEWNIHHEIGVKAGVLVWHIPPSDHLLMPESAASPNQYVWYIKSGQVPKAANLHLLKAS